MTKRTLWARWLLAPCLLVATVAAAQDSTPRSSESPVVPAPASAESPSTRTLLIGVKPAPPFVIADGDSYNGLSIDLWKETAVENGWRYQIREYDLDELLDAVATGEVDVGMGAITTTAEREQRMDFSHPLTSSGLGIAVLNEQSASLRAVATALVSPAFLSVIGFLVLLLFGVGLVAWLLERKHNPEQFGGGRAQGLFSGFWWAMVTMTTVGYGDVAPRTVPGRLLGMVWMLAALIIVSFFTASITSALTVGQLSGQIRSADDLPGVRVASLADSTSAQWLQARDYQFDTSADLASALQELADDKVDAVVYDAPLLRWQIDQNHKKRLKVLPVRLERQDYAFALPPGSPLREKINSALLERINSPEWPDRLKEYFGEDD